MNYPLSDTVEIPETNIRSSTRILMLAPVEGKSVKNNIGLVDNRMFTGKQNLVVKMDPQTNLWSFMYTNKGLLPGALEGQFTSFSKAYEHAEGYFKRRNIQITEVKD